MRRLLPSAGLLVSLALVVYVLPGGIQPASAQGQPATSEARLAMADEAQVARALRSTPILFIENAGQFDEGARFQVRGGLGRGMWLAENAVWVTLVERPAALLDPEGRDLAPADGPLQGAQIKLSFVDANPHPSLEPFDHLETAVSYFSGNDPPQWRAEVPAWGGVRFECGQELAGFGRKPQFGADRSVVYWMQVPKAG